MHLFPIVVAACGVYASHAAQGKKPKSPTIPTVKIIDVLSSNGNFSSFLLSLQRSGLVDVLEDYENVTVLAPTNEAFDAIGVSHLKLDQDTLDQFIVDAPITSANVSGVEIYNSLNAKGSPYIKDVHIPVLFDNTDDSFMIENSEVVYPDLLAPSSNAVVQGLDSLLTNRKHSLCDYFADVGDLWSDVSFSLFAHLLTANDYCKKVKFSNVTMLLPSDEHASHNVNDVEYAYLINERGLKDRAILLNNYVLEGITGGNLPQTLRRNLNGDEVILSSRHSGEEIVVNNSSHAMNSNYLLSDGILHYFDSRILESPKKPIFTPRSYMIGLNRSDFVDEIDFRKLSSLIDNVTIPQTVFLVRDTSVSANGQLKNELLYQFAEGKLDLDHEMLADSKFCSQPSLGHCQKIKVGIVGGGMTVINDHSIIYPERYEVGNTYIYLVDDDIPTPPKLEHALGPMDRCAETLQYLDHFGFLKFKANKGNGYTVFLPTSDAWNRLDLTLTYLTANMKKMSKVLRNMQLNGLVYSDFEGQREISTGNDDSIMIEHQPESDIISINGTAELPFTFASQVLFKDGVAYPVDRVLIPDTVDISMLDLMETIDADEFINILKLVGYEDLLTNGNYSFIVPSTGALVMDNITAQSDPDFLVKFASLHILPGDAIKKVMACEPIIPTLLNDTHLSCHRLASGGLVLTIIEGNDHETRILRKGFTTDDTGLLLIDKPINPKWMDHPGTAPIHLHLPLVAILVGIVLGMALLASIITCCFVLTVGDTEPDEENRDGTVDETTPLAEPVEGSSDGYGSYEPQAPVEPVTKGFSERYSTHSTTQAMDCPRPI